MKTTIKLFAMALFAVLFTSCCNFGKVGTITGEKKILVNEYTGAKGGMITVEKTVPVTHNCCKCGSSFCPKPQCCGIVNRSVLSRATGQSGTGEPPIGLIPTMKTLAP
ncbi:MAG: hypothetical protein ACSHX6_08845 [Akkermansiaceae bacterium]